MTIKTNKVNLLEGSIAIPILSFFFPILIGTFFQQLYNTIDAVVVGNFIGKEALSAVGGTTATLINLLVGFITGISSGATVVVSQYYGNQESLKTRKAVYSSMFLAVVLGAFVLVSGTLLAPYLLQNMNVPHEVFVLAVKYMRLYLLGVIPAMIYNTGTGILRAVGDAKKPLYFLIFSCLINMILDILFVVVFHGEVEAVAWATTISQTMSAFLVLKSLSATTEMYSFHLKELSYDKELLTRIISIGLPTGLQATLFSIANVMIQSSINRYGVNAMAAYTIFGKVDSLYWMTSGAFGTAVLTFCGQNFGAGKIDRVKRGFRISLLLDLLISAVLAALLYFAGEFLFRLFTNDSEVIALAVMMIRFLCPWWILFIVIEVFASGIRSCGDSFSTMFIVGIGIGGFRILWLQFYPAKNVLDTLWCYPLSWIITGALFLLYYGSGIWLTRSLAAREKLMKK